MNDSIDAKGTKATIDPDGYINGAGPRMFRPTLYSVIEEVCVGCISVEQPKR